MGKYLGSLAHGNLHKSWPKVEEHFLQFLILSIDQSCFTPNFWISSAGDIASRISGVIRQRYSMRNECFNIMLFAQQIVTSCLKNFKEVNRKSHGTWLWEFEYWETTANLEFATSAPLPHQGAVALLQQLRHHAVRENVAGPPAIKGHGIS